MSAIHRGTVVPLVTPVTSAGDLDEPSLGRLIESILAAGVEGIFVLGTTGEGVSFPRASRLRVVQCAVDCVRARALVYAGIGDTCLADSVAAANAYLRAGADAVVAQPPVYFPVQPNELQAYFKSLLDQLKGPALLYNIPSTTRVSIPLKVLAGLLGHRRLVGFKDSENDAKRLEELLGCFHDRPDFSIFIGVGALMARGLRFGAEGIVPSVGNLIPETCRELCASAARGDWAEVERHAERMTAIAALYQKDRTLGQSLAALKAALHLRGLIQPHMLPPLLACDASQIEMIRAEMSRLRI